MLGYGREHLVERKRARNVLEQRVYRARHIDIEVAAPHRAIREYPQLVGIFLNTVYDLSNYAKYPVRYMGKAFASIMFFVIPFGLFLYYPVECLVTGANIWWSVLNVAGAYAEHIVSTMRDANRTY